MHGSRVDTVGWAAASVPRAALKDPWKAIGMSAVRGAEQNVPLFAVSRELDAFPLSNHSRDNGGLKLLL